MLVLGTCMGMNTNEKNKNLRAANKKKMNNALWMCMTFKWWFEVTEIIGVAVLALISFPSQVRLWHFWSGIIWERKKHHTEKARAHRTDMGSRGRWACPCTAAPVCPAAVACAAQTHSIRPGCQMNKQKYQKNNNTITRCSNNNEC